MQPIKPFNTLYFNFIITISILFFGNQLAHAQVTWETVGPGGGGWITAMTVIDDAANTVYVGCDVGGIYKSTDHGATWTIKDDGLSIYYVHDIAYETGNTAVLYLASRGGVFKSVDGGEHWVAKRSGFPPVSEYVFSAPISDIVIDPNSENIVYAGIGVPRTGYDLDSYHWQSVETKGAIYKSTDSGENWTLIRNTGIDTMAMIYSMDIDPSNSNIIYAATSEGVYKSNDAGATWVSKNSGIPHGLTMKLVINPTNTDMLYVTVWAEPGSAIWEGGVYKSTDGGDTWVAKNNGLPQQVGSVSGLTSNFPTVLMDPQNPQILYVGNIPWTPDPGIYKTTDGGENWTWVSRPEPPNQNVDLGWIQDAGVGAKAMAIDPLHPSRLYFGTSMHLFKTENAGTSWEQTYTNSLANGYWKGNGFETTVVQKITVDPANSNNVYVGYWDIGLFKSVDGGVSFKNTSAGMTYKNNTFDMIVDPDNSSIVYASCGWWEENKGEINKSTDFGETWTPLTGLPDAQIWSMALDKNSPVGARILYATSYDNGVYKSTDGGQTWFSVSNGLGVNGNLQTRKITIDPNDSDILYVGIEAKQLEIGNANSTVQGGLFKSTDAGANWVRIDNSLPQISVWDIVVSPSNSQIIYTAVSTDYDHTQQTTFYGGVYKSTDGGSSWARVNTGFGVADNLNISALAMNSMDNNIIYATTVDDPYHDESSGRGIFKTTNGGSDWQAVNDGLGVLYYDAITIDPSNQSTLYAGSSGNGLSKGEDAMLTPLPVVIGSPFSAKLKDGSVFLRWETYAEDQNDGFEIQQSQDGTHWEVLDFVKSSGSKKYLVIDPHPLKGISYYKLIQKDLDGQKTELGIVSVEYTSIHPPFIFPNPTNDIIHISFLEKEDNAKVELQLFDDLGRLLFFQKNGNQLDISSLPSGNYHLVIRYKGQVWNERVVKK